IMGPPMPPAVVVSHSRCRLGAGILLLAGFVDAAAQQPPRCPAPSDYQQPELLPPSSPNEAQDADAPIEIEARAAEIAVGDAGIAAGTLRGDVRIRQGERTIDADAVEYQAHDNSFRVRGRIEYRDRVLRARGNGGQYAASSGASFAGAEFELLQRPARGRARSLDVRTDGSVDLHDVRFSTCPADDEAWRIKAGRLTLDTAARVGSGRDASITFKGVPLVYLPFISFPLGSQRKTGFLFPDFGFSSRSGAELNAPFYWNLHPQFDVTATPTWYSRRGIDLAGELRLLTARQRATLLFNYLPNDRLADRERSRVVLTHRAELPSGWRSEIAAENVGDPLYFEDFAQGTQGTSAAFTERHAALSYQDEHWSVLGQLQHFQTIDTALPRSERPYARLPRLLARGEYRFGSLFAGLDAEVVRFARNTGIVGWRADAAPRIGFDWSGPGYFLRPTLGYRVTQYDLSRVTPGAERRPSRSLPFASVDSGLALERLLSGSVSHRLILEPRLYYLYVPFREQTALPLFDTQLPDLTLAQLMSPNRFTGPDRIGDANQISAALTARVIDTVTGAERVAATVGQALYFETPRVLLPGQPVRTIKRSDLLAELTLTAARDWRIEANLQWNPQLRHTERGQLRLQYRPSGERVVNVAYRSQRSIGVGVLGGVPLPLSERLEQGEVSIAWPVRDRWQFFARAVEDFGAQKALERFVGLEYRACCWRLRAIARRFVSSRTGETDSGLALQLELNGLASVGSSADAFLEGAIRGYSPRGSVPGAGSR
ncbi:MAG: LPS assembly protein LptD, partial [Steroidobacteraceae bacterium]|nr:LPS assembly protein LptD [Steroidobacteraceae bacterium]MDW8259583.1 LPS assembly protein LptD [Gammaproteobacteria bacterium]